MKMFSPAKNLNDFLRTRPPLVIFTICLLALAISTYSFAFYIEQHELIVDSDRLEDWIRMKKHFNKLDVCIQNRNQNTYNKKESIFVEETSIFQIAEISNIKQLQKYEIVQGDLSLTDWNCNCEKVVEKPDSLKITFLVPQTSSKNVTNICVKLSGPAEYLPKFSESPCYFKDQNNKNKGYLTSSMHTKNIEGCVNGISANLSLDPKSNDNFAVYLTQEEKNIIYFHLMWCSYVLVIIIIVNLLYAIFHKHKTHVEDI